MKKTYLKIQPIQISNFGKQPKTVNAITWNCSSLERNTSSAILFCELAFIDPQDAEEKDFYPTHHTFTMEVPKEVLDLWGDDSVIDDFVLTYSSDFIKA